MKALILSLLLLAPACPRAEGPSEGELEKARKASAAGSQERAFDIAMLGLKSDPANEDLLLLAVENLPERSPSRAKRLADFVAPRIEKKAPGYAWHLGACKALRVLSKFPEAVANCRRALEAEPTAYPPYRELGLTYAAAGRPRRAAETLEQGVEISSSNYRARYHLARVLEKRGDTARAEAAYKAGYALAARVSGRDAEHYSALIRAGMRRVSDLRKKASSKARKPASKEQAETCRDRFREEFLKDNLGTALQASDACVKLSPKDPELAAERAPLMVRLGKYEDGVTEYQRAAGLYGDKGPQAALCRVKAAETWQKLGAPDKAIEQYRLAHKADPEDTGALRGLAAALEARSDFKGASEAYARILELDPDDAKVRRRTEELEASVMSEDQIFEELKLRGAVDEKQPQLRPEDVKLFKALKAAELAGAVDYLKKKAPSARGASIRVTLGGKPRLLLSGYGYRLYVSLATRDAVKFFEKEGLGFRSIFQLRDEAGDPVFDKSGRLTPEGEGLWRAAVPGKKTWLLSYEAAPDSPRARASKEAEDKIASLQRNGYQEISEPEYLWLLKATKCPEFTLKNPPVKLQGSMPAVVELSDGTRPRYLLCFGGGCANECFNRLHTFVGAYRANNTAIVTGETNSSFFGIGGAKKRNFCEGGEVWMGDVSLSDNPCLTSRPGR